MMKVNFPTDSLYKTIKLSAYYNKVIDIDNLLPGPAGQRPLRQPAWLGVNHFKTPYMLV